MKTNGNALEFVHGRHMNNRSYRPNGLIRVTIHRVTVTEKNCYSLNFANRNRQIL